MARIVLIVLSLFAMSAWAQSIDIYRVEAQVANQSEAERTAAAKATLGDVIVHVTGDSAALQHPLVRQAINDAPNYLAKFSYSTEKTLVLNYSPLAINKLLQQAQLVAASGAQGGVALQITGVQNFSSFKQVQAYLKTLAVIRRAELISVTNDVMLFNVTLEGDVTLLKTSLSASNKLQAEAVTDASLLSFHWQN